MTGAAPVSRPWRLAIGLAVAVPAAQLPDFLFGSPSPIRFVWAFVLGGLVLAAAAAPVSRLQALPWGRILAVAAAVAFLAYTALSIRHYATYGDILARDTAYYDQIFQSALEGSAPWTGSILQALFHDPPLEGHWAIHFTPIAYLILPFYAVAPGVNTLLASRNLLLILAAWPMYLLAARRLGRESAFVLTLALFATPTMLHQPLNAFYFYVGAVAPFLWAWYFAEEGRLLGLVAACAALLLVREDMGIAVAALGGVAAFDHILRRRAGREAGSTDIIIAGGVLVVVGAVWWVGVSRFVMPHWGSATGAATMSWYSGWSEHGADPAYALSVLFAPVKLSYVWQIARSSGFLGLAALPALAGAPYAGINVLVTSEGAATAAPTYHYSLLVVAGLYAAVPRVVGRLAGRGTAWRQRQLTLAVFVFGMSASAATLVYSGDTLRSLRGGTEVALFDDLIERIPADAQSVAAPSRLLPGLTQHRLLYASDRPQGHEPVGVQWIILAEGEGTYHHGEWSAERWTAYLDQFRTNPDYERVHADGGYGVYRRRP
jgi:uncharacterized membrane protein